MALGALLFEQQSSFPDSYQLWKENNKNIVGLSNLYVKYSYQPFSSNFDSNKIDPRTYFWIHKFLEQQPKNTNLAFVTTWFENIDENRNRTHTVNMPFLCNNVDATVASNTIFGLTKTVLTDPDYATWFSPSLRQVYENTAELLAWGIETAAIFNRPDLSLVYYPPVQDFLWFLSRTVFTLENKSIQDKSLQYVYKVFSEAIRNAGTKYILQESKSTSSSPQWIFWDDFVVN